MVKEKIKKLKSLLSENSNLKKCRQEHIIFSEFIIEKMKKLQDILFREYGVSGRRGIISLAVLYLLEDFEDNKSKIKTDGKEI